MNLFIPSISQKLYLAANWEFTLYNEYRNEKFIDSLILAGILKGPRHRSYTDYQKPIAKISIPKGALLTVSRIYIRQGKKDFDSVTFSVNFKLPPTATSKTRTVKGRFWAKLNDVNTLQFEFDPAFIPTATPVNLESSDFV